MPVVCRDVPRARLKKTQTKQTTDAPSRGIYKPQNNHRRLFNVPRARLLCGFVIAEGDALSARLYKRTDIMTKERTSNERPSFQDFLEFYLINNLHPIFLRVLQLAPGVRAGQNEIRLL